MDDLEHIFQTAIDHQNSGRLDQAGILYRQVLEIDPANANALNLLGTLSQARGDYQGAVNLIAKAILLDPGVAGYHINAAAAYLAQRQAESAAQHLETALTIDPAADTAHFNLGNARFALGDVDRAVEHFRGACDLEPGNQAYWSNYLFALNFASDVDRQSVFDENRRWGTAIEALAPKSPDFTAPEFEPDRPLRLAYYVPEWNTHVSLRFLQPVWTAQDRNKFRITCFGSATTGGPPPARLVGLVDEWVDIGGQGDAEVAAAMRAQGIDILLHPCTFKSRYRTILAHRGAPVQIAGINLVSTTGLASCDFLITDNILDPPPGTDAFYCERLIRLPAFNTYQAPVDAPDVTNLPAMAKGYVTFGSFNNPAKITSSVLGVWAQILIAAPEARLIFKHRAFDDDGIRTRFKNHFDSQGIKADRLTFQGYTENSSAYLSNYGNIDIALDPFPFGGGTTSYEAIWMGAPVVTLAAETLMGRLSAQLMGRVGQNEFIADSESDYLAKAVRLAGNIDKLAKIRAGLRNSARDTIFNGRAFTRNLEAALMTAWRDYCANPKD